MISEIGKNFQRKWRRKMRFKTFLEARAENSAKLEFVNISKIREFLENNCKDSLWMFKQNAPLYRGFRKLDDSHPTYVDLRGTQRASENTSNWYTEIFDNHPEMKDFPKRSKSLICTTDFDYSRQFGKPSVVIPVDGAKIGLAGTEDIWDLRMELFGGATGGSIKDANNTLQRIVWACQNDVRTKDASFEQLEQIDAILKTPNNEIINRLSGDPYQFDLNFKKIIKDPDFTDNFLQSILDAYSPTKLGFTSATTKNFKPNELQEIWFDTGAVVIGMQKWEEMRNRFS